MEEFNEDNNNNRKRRGSRVFTSNKVTFRNRNFVSRNIGRRYSLYRAPHFLKLRGTIPVSSNGSGLLVATFPVNPSIWDGTNAMAEWAALSGLYDSYMVRGVKIRWVPDKPNDTSTTTNYRPCYNNQDMDSNTVPTSIAQILEYDNFSVFDLSKSWQKYFRISKFTGGGTTGVILQGGWIDIASPVSQGSISFRSEGLDLSDNYGHFIVTQYVAFKNRR